MRRMLTIFTCLALAGSLAGCYVYGGRPGYGGQYYYGGGGGGYYGQPYNGYGGDYHGRYHHGYGQGDGYQGGGY